MASEQMTPRPGESRRVKIDSEGARLVMLETDNALLRSAISRLESAGARRELVTQELKHRIGNVLAVAQAIARQTFSNADLDSMDDFTARMLALGNAQNMLIESETRPTTIADVMRNAMSPHQAVGDRTTMSGPELLLSGRRAYALTLALHELATNAAKYGSLSVEGGWVEIVWTVIDGSLEITWREHAGPPTVKPTRQGFGSRLITRNLAIAFGGEVNLDFKPSGLECRLCSPAHTPMTPGKT